MKNITLKSSMFIMGLFCMSAFLYNCEKGDPGPTGPNGATGTTGGAGTTGAAGANGINGLNGTNGEGFEDALKNGNILVYLDGTRPDGKDFKDTLDFKFSTTDLGGSSIYRNQSPSDSNNSSYVRRYPDLDGLEINYTESEDTDNARSYFHFIVDSEGDTIISHSLNLYASVAFPTEHKYFQLNNQFYFDDYFDGETDGGNADDITISSYSYDNSTGSLKYKLSYVVPAGNNDSDHELKVTVVVNAHVFITMENSEEGRVATNGRVASKKSG